MTQRTHGTPDPLTVPRWWRVCAFLLFLAVGITLILLGGWLLVQIGTDVCTSEAHLSDLCDPYLPGVPGKEGR
ncbi:MAG: hypothetical protein Q8N00_11330 [Nitrospirota bacterium]|nr:hypothetical protein [Nitrospirota bacterium]MDP3596172.1 hypothetical protein [Nitrospirota bacterium]